MANELYRQVIHLFAGVIAAVAAFVLPRTAFLWLSGLAVVLSLLIILFFTHEFKWVINTLERDHVAFIGKGLLFFALGIFFTGLLFFDQAGYAILVLSLPDAAATLIGSSFYSPKLPYNHRKTILGSTVFFVTACVVLSVAVFMRDLPALSIFFIAFLLTALESFDYREIPFLDDNIVIPVVTGYLLSLL